MIIDIIINDKNRSAVVKLKYDLTNRNRGETDIVKCETTFSVEIGRELPKDFLLNLEKQIFGAIDLILVLAESRQGENPVIDFLIESLQNLELELKKGKKWLRRSDNEKNTA